MNVGSKITVIALILTLTFIRLCYINWSAPQKANILTWDAFGYYLYLPGHFIYHDIQKMEWVEGVIEKYQTTGNLYQLSTLPNGNRVCKYFAGIAIINSPFFLAGHIAAGWLHYPRDGFSLPYQLAICFSALFYSFLGLWILRRVLIIYFSDAVVSITLCLIVLGTNYPQYVSVDAAMTHGYIFTLYALLLLLTIRWHEKPNILIAFLLGLIIGLGIITRPTEGVMIFVPIFYWMHDAKSRKEKRELIISHRSHLLLAFIGGCIGMLPQLLYWKEVTGKWIYDVGSKWYFLSPHFRVLFGWEKGWFIYTPIAILMVLGIFFLKKNPFYRSVLIFFVINVWIITAWADWRYGASYSARALVQSYAVMALPLAALMQKITTYKWRYFVFGFLCFLCFVNMFQIWQYNKGILHYNDMNRRYYQAIYLNPCPSPIQLSLLDTKEYLRTEENYMVKSEINIDSQFMMNVVRIPKIILFGKNVNDIRNLDLSKETWVHIKARVLSAWGAYDSYLSTQITYNDVNKQTNVRLQNGMSVPMKWNDIEYYFKIPANITSGELVVFIETKTEEDIFIKDTQLKFLQKQ